LAITYFLCIYLKKARSIKIGKLGRFYFKKGNYIYVGSARKKLVKRIERHLTKKKKKFWHIDYLLQYANVNAVWMCNQPEERMANILSKKMAMPVLGFGSTDKKSKSHLFYGKIDKPFLLKNFHLRNLLSYRRHQKLLLQFIDSI